MLIVYLEDEQIILTKLNYELQLRRRNDGGECRVFSQFERGACPKIPRGFAVQVCPETPHHYWRSQSQPHNLFKFGQIKVRLWQTALPKPHVREAVKVATKLVSAHGPFQIEAARYTERDPHPGGQEAFVARVKFPWYPSPLCRIKVEITHNEPVLLECRRSCKNV